MGTGQDRRWGDRLGLGLAAAGLVVLVGFTVLFPAATVLASAIWAHPPERPTTTLPALSWPALGNTILYCLGIGVIATAAALPVAWLLRRASAAWAALVAVPLLMPTYLAYSGWGMIRGPSATGHGFGDWLARQPPWASLLMDKILAVGGLSLWAWPLAAFILSASTRRVPGNLLDVLSISGGSWLRRAGVMLRLLAPGIAASVGAVSLVMAGSAIPLHLAQVQTFAIHLWKVMDLTPDASAVWKASWPLVIIAAVGAKVVASRMAAPRVEMRDEGDTTERRTGRWAGISCVGVWAASVLVPFSLFALGLRSWSSVPGFWRMSTGGVVQSLRTATTTGAIAALVCAGVWAVLSSRGGRGGAAMAARWCVQSLVFAGLMPGVLVGKAVLMTWNSSDAARVVGDSWMVICLAHTARFAFVAALAGWWLARMESTEERDLRAMVGADGLTGWAVACLPRQWTAILGVGLAVAAMSFHEIESTVLVQPPGPGNLAQHLLDLLHYSRYEDLCAAGVNLLSLGTLAAFGAAWLLSKGLSAGKRAGERPPGGETRKA